MRGGSGGQIRLCRSAGLRPLWGCTKLLVGQMRLCVLKTAGKHVFVVANGLYARRGMRREEEKHDHKDSQGRRLSCYQGLEPFSRHSCGAVSSVRTDRSRRRSPDAQHFARVKVEAAWCGRRV